MASPWPVQLLVRNLQFEDGKMIPAAQYFSSGSSAAVELTEEERSFAEQMRVEHAVPAEPSSLDGGLNLRPFAGGVAEHPEQREPDRGRHRLLQGGGCFHGRGQVRTLIDVAIGRIAPPPTCQVITQANWWGGVSSDSWRR